MRFLGVLRMVGFMACILGYGALVNGIVDASSNCVILGQWAIVLLLFLKIAKTELKSIKQNAKTRVNHGPNPQAETQSHSNGVKGCREIIKPHHRWYQPTQGKYPTISLIKSQQPGSCIISDDYSLSSHYQSLTLIPYNLESFHMLPSSASFSCPRGGFNRRWEWTGKNTAGRDWFLSQLND